MFDLEQEIALLLMQGIGPQLAVRGKSHGFSGVATGTWTTFSSYCGDGHSKLEFGQPSQDSGLVAIDNSGI